MKNPFTSPLILLLAVSAAQLPAAVIYASNVTQLLRGNATIGDHPEFYGGDTFSYPVPFTEDDARFAITGEPDGVFLSLPGRNDTPVGTGFLYSYAELAFPTTFSAAGTTLTVHESADAGEQALLWLWVSGGGFIHANASVRNIAEGFSIDLSSLQPVLDSFGPGAVFERVGIGGLDLLGASQGFDLDAVSITTGETSSITATPEPTTGALVGGLLIVVGLIRRRP